MFDNQFWGCMCGRRVFVVFTDTCGGPHHGQCQSEVTDHTGRDVSIPCPGDGSQLPTPLHLGPTESESTSPGGSYVCLRSTSLSHCFLLPHSVDSNEMFSSSLVFCCPFKSHRAATYWKDCGWQGWQRQSMQSGFQSLDRLSGAQCKERSKC